MSLQAITQALNFAPAHWSPSVQLVAIVIADHTGNEGDCWPSIRTISARCRLDRRSVQRILRQLEREGVIVKSARFADDRQTSNLYKWQMLEASTNWEKPANFLAG